MGTSQSLIVKTDHHTSFHTKIAWTVFIAIVVSAGTPKEVCMCVLVVYTGKEPGEESPKAPWRRKVAAAAYSSSNAWKLEEEAKGAGFDDSSFGVSKVFNN